MPSKQRSRTLAEGLKRKRKYDQNMQRIQSKEELLRPVIRTRRSPGCKTRTTCNMTPTKKYHSRGSKMQILASTSAPTRIRAKNTRRRSPSVRTEIKETGRTPTALPKRKDTCKIASEVRTIPARSRSCPYTPPNLCTVSKGPAK